MKTVKELSEEFKQLKPSRDHQWSLHSDRETIWQGDEKLPCLAMSIYSERDAEFILFCYKYLPTLIELLDYSELKIRGLHESNKTLEARCDSLMYIIESHKKIIKQLIDAGEKLITASDLFELEEAKENFTKLSKGSN